MIGKTLDERVEALEALYTDLPGILNTRLENLSRRIDENNDRMGLLDRQLATLTRDIRDLRAGVTRQLLAQDERISEILKLSVAIEARLGALEKRQEGFEKRQDAFEKRQEGFEKRQEAFEARMGTFEIRMGTFEARMDGFERQQAATHQKLDAILARLA
jgi:chromosome segregation ATPase